MSALLQSSDILAGFSGIAIEAGVRPSKANAKEFGKYTITSILSRMITSSSLSGSVDVGNQQYVFAGFIGGGMAGGSNENMFKSAAYNVAAVYLGDLLAEKLNIERDIIGGRVASASSSGTPAGGGV